MKYSLLIATYFREFTSSWFEVKGIFLILKEKVVLKNITELSQS